MSDWLKDKDKRRGMLTTISVHVVLLILFTIFGLKQIIPPPEDGIAINFGYDISGDGDNENTNQDENEDNATESSSTPTTDSEESVVTQDNTDAPTIEKKPEKKPDTEVEKKPTPDTKPNNPLFDDYFNNPGGGQGDGGDQGNQGDPTGDPTAPNNGTGGTGDMGDYQLGGRKALETPRPIYDCNEEGIVIVQVWVNRQGKVIRAKAGAKGSTTTAPCLYARAEEAALKTIWQGNVNAPDEQAGTIKYRFRKK
jgi:periplasmic protein TonB